jgi:phage baseplate assembly protein W
MTIRDDITGTGIAFPLRPSPAGGLEYASGADNIEQSLRLLLLTNQRERVMRNDYGTRARDLVFAPGSEQGLRLLETGISDAIRDWEPRIDVLSITATADSAQPSAITVEIDYRIRATYVRGNLIYPLYLDQAEGAP